MADAFSIFDWPHTVRHIPSADGHYDRVEQEYDDGNATPNVITGHKTVITRQEAESWRFTPDVGDIRNGDCIFFSTTEMKRNDFVEFNENAGGTIVTRYRIEAIGHRHSLIAKLVADQAVRIAYYLREVQHNGA